MFPPTSWRPARLTAGKSWTDNDVSELGLQFQGMEDLLYAFSVLPEVTGRNMRRAVKTSAVMVQEEAQQVHRFQTRKGTLESAIDVSISTTEAVSKVFLNDGVARYGKWIHDGSRPHVIRPKNKKLLRWVQNGRFRSAKLVHHPGTKPDPFIYEAAERKRGEVQALIQTEGIDKSLRQVGIA